jgi:PleD family two-component response regulator
VEEEKSMKAKLMILIQEEETRLHHNLKERLNRRGVDVIEVVDPVHLLVAVQQRKADFIVPRSTRWMAMRRWLPLRRFST